MRSKLILTIVCAVTLFLFSCCPKDIPLEIKQFQAALRHALEIKDNDAQVERYNSCYSSVSYVVDKHKTSVNCKTVTVHANKEDGSCRYSTNMNQDKMDLIEFFVYVERFCGDIDENSSN